MDEIYLDVTWKHPTATIQSDSLTASFTTAARYRGVKATAGRTKGKWYWEVEILGHSTGAYGGGVCNSQLNTSQLLGTTSSITSVNGVKVYLNTQSMYNPAITTGLDAFGEGDILGYALDLDSGNGILRFYKNGILQKPFYNDVKSIGEEFFPMIIVSSTASPTININFGGSPFKHSVPEGYIPYQFTNKIVVVASGQAYSVVSGTWENIGVIPTDLTERTMFYKDYGMDEITREQLRTLPAVIPNGKGKVSVLRI